MELLLLLFIGGLLKTLALSAGCRMPDGRMLVTNWKGCVTGSSHDVI
jgi:hypothetical protein